MRQKIWLFSSLLALSLVTASARATDLDLEVAALVGSGVDTGDAPNNPYALQVGAVGELIINGYVLGVRGTRSFSSDSDNAASVADLRSLGGDFGFEWSFALLHIGPRIGAGRLRERDGDLRSGYLEPGAVAEVELGILAAGIDVRYRIALKDADASALLAYAKLGLRF